MCASAVLALLVFAPGAQSRAAVALSLNVSFFANGTISVALPDGTPVGTSSGAPTVIPAGYYTVRLVGPGGCVYLPNWELKGPGESVVNNLDDGEVMSTGFVANFLPSSTYIWRNDGTTPPATFTFVTSADVQGTAPTGVSPTTSQPATRPMGSGDLVGSKVAAIRGTLNGVVTAAGKLSLAFRGKGVSSLQAGRYKLTVTDRSPKSGFMLERANRPAMTMAGIGMIGRRIVTVTLTAGRWFFSPTPSGKKTGFTVKA